MSRIIITTFLALSIIMSSCAASSEMQKRVVKPVGNDRDRHGCIASAGYQWSELLGTCIRPFEKGIRLHNCSGKETVMAAYLVFNADSSKVEVYMPQANGHAVSLKRKASPVGLWKGHGSICVQCIDDRWKIFKSGRVLYSQTR